VSTDEPLVDVPGGFPVLDSVERFRGAKFSLVSDAVELPGQDTVARDVVRHPSAVAVLALDDAERVLLVHQYRHPVAARLWELPAGLLDEAGESPADAAARELWEETGYHAKTWWVLADYHASPGMSDEAVRIFLAREVAASDGPAHDRRGEESFMTVRFAPLDDLVEAVLARRLHNPSLVVGVLAAAAWRARGWQGLAGADAAWPLGPHSSL